MSPDFYFLSEISNIRCITDWSQQGTRMVGQLLPGQYQTCTHVYTKCRPGPTRSVSELCQNVGQGYGVQKHVLSDCWYYGQLFSVQATVHNFIRFSRFQYKARVQNFIIFSMCNTGPHYMISAMCFPDFWFYGHMF